ncbi:MFS transporter [Streptomyces sp. NPDC102381]|uniref:MFS transporter n=1 Tax=Streptomyces sp. NPDC102381 TaxID=3366164 RepID=UPI0038225AB7
MGTPPATPLRELFLRLSARRRAAVIAAVVTTAFLSSLDAMVMSTAMPRVVEGLGGAEALYPWVVTAYLLSSTAVLPLYGRYSDLYGRRPAILIGLAAFLLGSALCALAGSMAQLIAYRTVQGLGAGALLAVSMSLIRELFSIEALKKLQMIMGSMMATSFIGGPFIGGALTDLLGWRSVFWLNLVIGLPTLWILATLLPYYREPHAPRGRQDVAGVLLLIGCITVTLIGLTQKSRTEPDGTLTSWADPGVVGCLVAGAVLLAVFVANERRAAIPLLPLRLFRLRNHSAIVVIAFFYSIALFPAVIYLPLYFQQTRGMQATTSGMMIFPMMIGLVGSNLACAPLIWKSGWGKRVLGIGAVLLGIGAALFGLVDEDTALPLLFLFMLLLGLGMGPSMAAIGLMAQNSVPRSDIGTATSSTMLSKAVGNAVGLAVGQSLLASLLNSGGDGGSATGAETEAIMSTIQIVGVVGAVCVLAGVALIKDLTIEKWNGPSAAPKAAAVQQAEAD